jgi:hypothetical protein
VRHSSIFNFDSWQVRLPFAPWAIIFVVILIIAELVLRVPPVVNALPDPEPTLWHAELIQTKLDYFKAFEEEQDIDVLFLGNSTMQAGLNPDAFDLARMQQVDTSMVGSFNGSIEGMPPFGTSMFLDIYLRYSNPEVIIYGITPQDLNGNSPWAADITDRVKHAPMALAESQRGIKGRSIDFFLNHSNLYRYRLVLYRLVLGDQSVFEQPSIYFDERGYHSIDFRLSSVPAEERGVYYNSAGVVNYDIDGLQSESFEEIIQKIQEAEIELIIVNMPLADDYYGNFDSLEDYDAYYEALVEITEKYELPLIDLETVPDSIRFDDDEFADFNHLNEYGAQRFSEYLGQQFLVLMERRETAVTQ